MAKSLVISRAHKLVLTMLSHQWCGNSNIKCLAMVTGLSKPELQRLLDELVEFNNVEARKDGSYVRTEKGAKHVGVSD
jgi:hypothetical protein